MCELLEMNLIYVPQYGIIELNVKNENPFVNYF
nr:MAG TPA: hypothetical protein [Caudoviricetes sp.]